MEVQAIKDVFEETFEATQKSLEEKVDAGIEDVKTSVKSDIDSVRDELATISATAKAASPVLTEDGKFTQKTLNAVGNSFKEFFGREVAEDAVSLKDIISGSVTGDGEELMFTELHRGILDLAEHYGVFLRDAERFTTNERTYRLVYDNETGDNGGYDAEGADRAEDALGFTAKEVTIQKWRKIIGTSMEAIEDSAPAELGAWILTKLAEKFGLFIENRGFTVLTTDTNTQFHTLPGTGAGDLSYDDLIDVQDLVKTSVRNNGAFYMHPKVWSVIRKMKDSNNRPLLEIANRSVVENTTNVNGLSPVGYFDNHPIYLTEALTGDFGTASTPMIVFGDLKNSVVNIVSRDFSVESNDRQKWTSDIVLVKGRSRHRVEILHSDAYGVIRTA